MNAPRMVEESANGVSCWARKLVAFTGRRAWAVLAVALVTAIVSAVCAAMWVGFNPDRNDLIEPHLPWNADFVDWHDHFSASGDLLVAIDTQRDADTAERFTSELADRLADEPLVERLVWRYDTTNVPARVVRLLPSDEFWRTLDAMREAAAGYSPPTLVGFAAQLELWLRSPASRHIDVSRADDLLAMARALDDQAAGRAEAPDERLSFMGTSQALLTTPNGRFIVMRVTPRPFDTGGHRMAAAVDAIRRTLAATAEAVPGVDAGLTGVDAIEVEETLAITRDATISSIVAAVAIAVLLVLFARSVLLPIALLATLAVGVAWSFGWLFVSVGHLQLLSVVFVAVLLGLGVDFGVHITSAMRTAAAGDAHGADPLAWGLSRCGPGLIVGGVTTAIAFAVLAVTDFRAIGELGVIVAGGLVLCMVASFVVLPALLHVLSGARGSAPRSWHEPPRWFPGRGVIGGAFEQRPAWVLVPFVVVLIGALLVATRIGVNRDLTDLQPAGLDATEWQTKLLDEGGVSAWFAVSVADSEDEARRLVEAYRALPSVGHVGGYGVLMPEDESVRLDAVEDVRTLLPSVDGTQPTPIEPSRLAASLDRLAAAMRQRASEDTTTQASAALDEAASHIANAAAAVRTDGSSATAARDRLATAYEHERSDVLGQLRGALEDAPILAADLPPAVTTHFVDRSGPTPRYAVEVHPTPPDPAESDSVLDGPFLKRIEADYEAIDPHVTGGLLQVARSGDMIFAAFGRAGLLAVGAVTVVLLIALRSVRDTLVSLIPPASGFAIALAWLYLWGGSLDAANIIALPILFGVGVDAGVHMVHRARATPDDGPTGLSHGTGVAIAFSMITTTIGFAALLIAEHRGLRSLGAVMSVGLLATLGVCLLVMPALLRVVEPRPNGRRTSIPQTGA